MKSISKITTLVAVLCLAGLTTSASAQSATKSTTAKEQVSRAFTNGANVPSSGVAIEGYCPVCYIAANKAAKGSPEFSYDYEGITYWFVSDDVRNMFKSDPKKYVPSYGGWCALGVAMGQRFPVDPTNFKVVDGKILLFLKNAKVDGAELWNQNADDNLGKANANWEKLKG